MRYFIKTFGCQANLADSERIASYLEARGMKPAKEVKQADYVIINSCIVRQSAENRVYGLVNNLSRQKLTLGRPQKIILTGCLVGLAVKEKSGQILKTLKKRLPLVDEFLPIEEVGFEHNPLRSSQEHAWVPISNGCNNFCTFCVVPFSRGREVSRPFEKILKECQELKKKNYQKITLLGQNVNSYGADLVKAQNLNNIYYLSQLNEERKKLKPVLVKHLGKYRLPTLFPYLLAEVAKLGFQEVNFLSANPWDFSEELIAVIAKYSNITRTIHLPLQSGDDEILKRMNRWYTAKEYFNLVKKIRKKIKGVKITTDIIVGFPGESKKQFENTLNLCQKIGFAKAYIAMYSPRPQTAAARFFPDDVPCQEKKRRWLILDKLINR